MQLLHYFRTGYGIALGTTLAAFLVTLFVGVWSVRPALALYLWAVVVSSYFGSWRAGLSSLTFAVLVLIGQFFLLPAGSPLRQQNDVVSTLVLFLLIGALASYLSHACSRTLEAARTSPGPVPLPVPVPAPVPEKEPVAVQPPSPLHAVAACAPTALIVLDTTGRCVYSNPACRTVAGIAPLDGLGDGWTRFVHPEDQEFAVEWQNAVQQEKPFATEIRFKGEDGRLRWAQLRASPLRSDEGRYLGQVGLLEDITLWKELEEDLSLQQKESEDLRRAHREQVQEIEARLAGIQKGQALLHEQLAEKDQAEQKLRRRHDEERVEWHQTEARLLRENAELRQAREVMAEKLAEQQEGEKLLAELEQVRATAKRTEDKLRHDLKDQRRARQTAEEALTELRKTEETRRSELERLQAEWGQSRERFRKEITDLTEMRQLLEAELADWQQKERQARAACEAVQREHADVRAELEESRRGWQEERESWQRERAEREQQARHSTSWLDRIAERLQPLTAALDQALRTDPAALAQHVRPLTVFAEGLWAASLLGRQGLLFRPEPTELGSLLNRVVAAAAPLVQAHGQHLTVTLPLEPLWLTVDPGRTEQALVALLDNACRFTEPGGRIELHAELRDEEIVFHVKDTGIGFNAEVADALLALDARQRQFSEETGLGLALVRGLVEEQGGQVEMLSEGEGHGSEFCLRFPMRTETLPMAELYEEAVNGEAA